MDHGAVKRREIVAAIIVSSVFLLTAGAALAAGSALPDTVNHSGSAGGSDDLTEASVSAAISGTVPVTGGNMIAGCLAAFFEVPVSDVLALHSEGYGWGELAIVYALAQESGWDVDDILAMKSSGIGWGEIAQFLGLPPSNRDRNLGRIVSGRVVASDTIPVGAQRLAERLGADPEEVAALLDQGASYGAVIVAYKLAGQYEGATPEDLVARRMEGTSWGQLKKELSSSATSTGSSGPPGQSGQPQGNGSADHGPPDHAANPDHPGRPDHAGPKDRDKKNK